MMDVDGGYQIPRSLRIRRSASGYLSRTFSTTPTLSTKYTLSFWMKRGQMGLVEGVFAARQSSSPSELITLEGGDTFFWAASNGLTIRTTAVFRDPSAWHHFVFTVDTTDATPANRAKIFLNNVQLAFSTASYPTQNSAVVLGSAIAHWIGSEHNGSGQLNFFDGYLAEVNFIDGQSIAPSAFGQTDPATGAWGPKKYVGTYGNNGFYLKFTNNSTANNLGLDYSGNSRNWTASNISVSAGATYDSMIDSPTNYADGDNGRGNYATLNPLVRLGSTNLTNGNITSNSTAPNNATQSTIAMPVGSGKWYAEFQSSGSQYPRVGIMDATDTNNNMQGSLTISWGGNTTGELYINGTLTAQSAGGYSTEVIGIAYDAATRRVWFSKNGVWQNFSGSGADPATNTNPAGTLAGSSDVFFALRSEACSINANFGQRPFAYNPPTGFKALNTQNLSDPAVKNSSTAMNVLLYTGNGTNDRTISGFSFNPDMAWVKNRSAGGTDHVLSSVPVSPNSSFPSSTIAEAAGYIKSLGTNSIVVGNPSNVNGSSNAMVSWYWKEGASPGFDIVTYTGNGASNRAIAHALGAAPKMIIVKWRGGSNNWAVSHTSLTNWNWYLNLNGTSGQTGDATVFPTTPDSSSFYVGTSSLSNGNTNGYVAYLWSEVPGFSRFGSYTGNGSSDGPFVYCGFRPRFVMVKKSSASSNWIIQDSARTPFNVAEEVLYPNRTDVTNAGLPGNNYSFDLLSSGFKIRNSGDDSNINGQTYIFAAFAENPFKYARAR